MLHMAPPQITGTMTVSTKFPRSTGSLFSLKEHFMGSTASGSGPGRSSMIAPGCMLPRASSLAGCQAPAQDAAAAAGGCMMPEIAQHDGVKVAAHTYEQVPENGRLRNLPCGRSGPMAHVAKFVRSRPAFFYWDDNTHEERRSSGRNR
jgi:hypothetical protein